MNPLFPCDRLVGMIFWSTASNCLCCVWHQRLSSLKRQHRVMTTIISWCWLFGRIQQQLPWTGCVWRGRRRRRAARQVRHCRHCQPERTHHRWTHVGVLTNSKSGTLLGGQDALGTTTGRLGSAAAEVVDDWDYETRQHATATTVDLMPRDDDKTGRNRDHRRSDATWRRPDATWRRSDATWRRRDRTQPRPPSTWCHVTSTWCHVTTTKTNKPSTATSAATTK